MVGFLGTNFNYMTKKSLIVILIIGLVWPVITGK
jgi:hypothetical protein